ncbi:MAG: SPOR domain-containing protein [Proteobacteria bacterium]|nr:SPOR domain-containing protein [Pseudomonadota bacterium]
MNSTLKKQAATETTGQERPAISPTVADVDEIERFLREEFEARNAEKQPEFTDPLMAELARIVGQEARPVAAAPPAMPPAHDPFAQAEAPGSANDPLRAFEEELRRFDAVNRRPVQEPEVAAVLGGVVQPAQAAPAYPDDFRAVGPAVAGHPASQPLPEPDFALLPQDQPVRMTGPETLGPEGVVAEDLAPVVPAAPRSRKVMYLLGGAAAFAVIGVVGSIAFSNKKPMGSSVPVIAAKTQPAKEKPADPGGVEVPGQDRQVLARKTDEPVKPASLVTKEEQPVDLSQTPKREVSRVILAQPTQGSPQGAASSAPAAPIIMPPGAAQPQQDAAQGQPTTAGGFEAKRVRSVKIGGDGSMVAAPASPAPVPRPSTPTLASAPPPAGAAVPKVEAPKAETPKAETPKAETPKVETAKSDARPVTAARQQARPVAQAPQPAASEGADAPMSLRPPAAGAQRPVRTAAATSPAERSAPDAQGGGFAVQLAAPGSESEARRTASRLKQRYSNALDGHTPGVRKAAVGGRTVYRVRVGGLSRQDATEMCTRIKGDGGSCFVASN